MMRKVIKIVIISLIIGLFIAKVPETALGEPAYIINDDNGLEIHVPEKTVNTDNLGPGDKKSSSLKLKNTGSSDLTVYIRTNILSETSPRGGGLADVMILTIRDGDSVIADGTFRDVADEGNILIGNMAPEAEKTIYFSADFPKEAGNEYQGASFKVNWTFTTESSGGGGGDEGGGGGSDEDEPAPPIEIEEEPIPEGEPKPPTEPSEPEPEPEVPVLEVPEEEIPAGVPEMPQTGEGAQYPYYLVGAFALLAGISLVKRRF